MLLDKNKSTIVMYFGETMIRIQIYLHIIFSWLKSEQILKSQSQLIPKYS